jgi:hypothetical protein
MTYTPDASGRQCSALALPECMTPRQFFDEVAQRNARLAIESQGDLRLAINAIMTLDALFGILHAALYETRIVSEPRDDQWKDKLADQNADHRLLRDAAYALKHGKLDGRKQRIFRRPSQLFTMPGAFDPAVFDPAVFDTGTVWLETDSTDYRADEVIERVAELAHSQLLMHGM